MKKSSSKKIKIAIVNIITTIRLIGALLLPFLYSKYGTDFISIFVLILFSTDAIDGFLARTFKVQTFFGGIMDAFSDKLLNAIAFIILGLEYHIMLAPLTLEIAISYTNYSTYRYGGNVKSSLIGKIKTIILDICVIMSFILLAIPTINSSNSLLIQLINAKDLIIYVFAFIILFSCLAALLDYTSKNKITRLNPMSKIIKTKSKELKPIKQIIDILFDTEYYKKHKDESIMEQIYLSN